jgi:hypothetical protein
MPSSGIVGCVALVRTDISEEHIASIIRVTRIGELGTMLAVTSNKSNRMLQLLITANVVPSLPILVTLMMEAIRSFEMLVLTRVIWHNIPGDGILLSYQHCFPPVKFQGM